jgi:putative DNA primase/helicase
MEKLDFKAAKAATKSVAEKYFGKLPKDRKVCCPFHDDGSPSMHVYEDGYHCFGCGERGDAIDLVCKLDGVDKLEAYRRIMGDSLLPFPAERRPKPKKNQWEYCIGAQGEPGVFGDLAPTDRWAYYDGIEVSGYVYRFDPPGNKKYFLQVTSRRHRETGEIAWRWMGWDDPTPLYRPENGKGALIIVEGEKCVEHLRPKIAACTWQGGWPGVKKADWNQVTAERVILWPDNDKNGKEAMEYVASVLGARGIKVSWVDISGLPEKADAADFEFAECIEMLKAAKSRDPEPEPEQIPPPAAATQSMPIKFLGYQDDTHYFLQLDSQVIIEAQPKGMTRNFLVGLLGLPYLEAMFTQRGKWSAEHAIDALRSQSIRAGVYSPEATRGRGIWLDDGRIIYHAGSVAYVDGVKTRPAEIQSRYTYPIAPDCVKPGEPLTDKEATRWVLEAACQPTWTMPAHGYLLSGWLMVSLLAGVLRWRPSMWIQAPAGSGKSAVLDYVVRIAGRMVEHANGSSTEAGLRQALRDDARIILCEEAEVNDEDDARRMKNLLTMMRQASSSGGAKTYRGTVGGKAQTFCSQAPWCFVSIQTSATLQADRERLARVTLRSAKTGTATYEEGKEAEEKLKQYMAEMPSDIHARLIGRALQLAPISREVVGMMIDAMGPHVQSRREADQLGTLMAGAWMLEHSEVPTHEQAREYVGAWRWDDINQGAQETDSDRVLDTLMNIRINADKGYQTVGSRLLSIRRGDGDTEKNSDVLAAYGLAWKERAKCLFVHINNHNLVAEFARTPYRGFADLLAALRGVTRSKQKCGGAQARHGLMIPLPDIENEADF